MARMGVSAEGRVRIARLQSRRMRASDFLPRYVHKGAGREEPYFYKPYFRFNAFLLRLRIMWAEKDLIFSGLEKEKLW